MQSQKYGILIIGNGDIPHGKFSQSDFNDVKAFIDTEWLEVDEKHLPTYVLTRVCERMSCENSKKLVYIWKQIKICFICFTRQLLRCSV